MSKFQEIIIEPNRIEISSTFKLKVRVIDKYQYKQNIVSENNICIMTENDKNIKTEWGQ